MPKFEVAFEREVTSTHKAKVVIDAPNQEAARIIAEASMRDNVDNISWSYVTHLMDKEGEPKFKRSSLVTE